MEWHSGDAEAEAAARADAILIAAAPAMLDALRAALAWIGHNNASGASPDPRAQIIEAIAKAEGHS